jgi:hypothetical protein
MSTRLATRMSLLTAAFVAGLALSFTPTPVHADEDPVVRQPRVRVAPPRVVRRAPVVRVRTVERVRYVPVYYSCGGCAPAVVTCGGCAPAVAAPTYYAPRYYAPTYYSGCGSCAQPAALPYYWAVRTARYWHAHGYYR